MGYTGSGGSAGSFFGVRFRVWGEVDLGKRDGGTCWGCEGTGVVDRQGTSSG